MTDFGFDRRNGELLVGVAAIEWRQEEAGADVLSLPELLVTPDFPFVPGDFERSKIEWDHDKCLAIGSWTLNMLAEHEEITPSLHKEHIRRLHVLGLGPGIKEVTVKNGFNYFTDFKQQVGAPMLDVRRLYADWDIDRALRYVNDTFGENKVTSEDINEKAAQGLGPSRYILKQMFGGVSKLNEKRGFPDVPGWEHSDYVDWGARVIAANGHDPSMLTTTVAEILSKRDRGPSWRTVLQRFGVWANFVSESTEVYQTLYKQAPDDVYQALSGERYTPKKTALRLICAYFLEFRNGGIETPAPEQLYTSFSSATQFILENVPDTTKDDISLVARRLKIDKVLYAPDTFHTHLFVSDEELRLARQKAVISRRRYPPSYAKRSVS